MAKSKNGFYDPRANLEWYQKSGINALTDFEEASAERHRIADTLTDGDTIGSARIVGVDSMESVGFDANNEKAQKILDEYGISYADQKKYGKQATEALRQKLLNPMLGEFSAAGHDVYGRPLIENKQLNDELLATGLYAPTDRYDKKSQDLFRKAQEKTARINSKQAEMMEAQRQYNISGQAPGILDRLGAPIDALQSGAQQLVAGTGDFLLDVLTPGNNNWLDEAKSAESADKTWGYNRKEAQFQQDELMNDWEQGNYGSALGTAALLAPEVIGESLPMMASMVTPTGLGRAAAVGLGAKALGATAKAAKAEGAIREANAINKFMTSMTDDGFMLAVGTTTNNHIDEFTANNGGVGPSYGEIARMTAINALQLGTDKFAFQDIIGAGPLTGFVKAMKPMTKVVPEGVLGSIGVGVARTAMAMGEEAGQEYFQTWAEILNGQLGTTKYGSLENIFANEQNQDEATLGALLGAGAGGVMHIGAMPVNAIKDKMNKGREEVERADANRQEMTRQLLSGELDLDTNPISFSGEGKVAAQNDVVLLASHSDNKVGTELAIAAMRPEVDTSDAIGKVDASLRRAFNVGENVVGIEAGLDPAVNEIRYQDTSFKIALKTLDKLSMVGTDTKANIDTSAQITEVMDAYAKILPPERLAQLHLNLLDRTIKTLQSAAMTDTANEGSTIAKSIGAAGESYKISTEFMTKALKQLHASENALGVSVMKGSYGGTSGGGFGSPKDALDAISMFAAGLAAKIQEAEKTGYAEFKGSPYDALKGTSQVASEILIKGKTGTNGIYGKGLIQHAIDISDDIAKAANSKKKTVNTANLKSFVDFAMQRFKKSTHKFTDSRNGKDFKSTFFPRTTIFGTEEETGLAQKRYLTNYHDQMDPSGNTAAQKKIEAQYMLDMIRRMIMLLEASKGQIEEKSYNDMMSDLRAVEAQQIADIKAADEVIAEKAANKDPDQMVAVSINKYLRKNAYIPANMRDLVNMFKANMSKENIGENQFYYVYVPLSYIDGGKKTGVSASEEYYANNEIDLSESDDADLAWEYGAETSRGSDEQVDEIKNDSLSRLKSLIDGYDKSFKPKTEYGGTTKFNVEDAVSSMYERINAIAEEDGDLADEIIDQVRATELYVLAEELSDIDNLVATNAQKEAAYIANTILENMVVELINGRKIPTSSGSESETKAKTSAISSVDRYTKFPDSDPFPALKDGWLKDTLVQNLKIAFNRKILEKVEDLAAHDMTMKEIVAELVKQGFNTNEDEVSAVRSYLDIPSMNINGMVNSDYAIWKEQYFANKKSETKAKVDENVDNKPEDGKSEPLKEEQTKDETDEQDGTSDEQENREGTSSGDSSTESRATRSREIPQGSQEAKSALKKLEEELESLKSELAAKIREVSDAMEEAFIFDSDGFDFVFDKNISLTKNMTVWRKAIVQKIKDNRANKSNAKDVKDKYKESMPGIKDTRKEITVKKKEVRKAESNVRSAERRESSKKFFIEELKTSYENNEQLWKIDSGSENSFSEASSKEKNTHFNDMWNKHKAEMNPEFDPAMFEEGYNEEIPTEADNTTAEPADKAAAGPKSSEQAKNTDKPVKFNMFTSLGDTKHDVKAEIDQIDATIASLKDEEKALRAKRVAELVEIMEADSMKLGTQEGGMIFRKDPAEEDKLREEQRKKWRRAAHLQVNKEFRGCF